MRRGPGGRRLLRGARGGAGAADGSCRLRVLRHLGEKGDIPGQIYPRVVESPSGTPFDPNVACFDVVFFFAEIHSPSFKISLLV